MDTPSPPRKGHIVIGAAEPRTVQTWDGSAWVPVTFELMALAEPMLAALETAAAAVRDDTTTGMFCANTVWYAAFKPLMAQYVGHGRARPHTSAADPYGDPMVRLDFDKLFAEGDQRIPADGNPWEEFLRTEAAYDIAYEHLYQMLPDCRDCRCM